MAGGLVDAHAGETCYADMEPVTECAEGVGGDTGAGGDSNASGEGSGTTTSGTWANI